MYLLVSALYLSAAAPNLGGEDLDVGDESLLRAMADEPARVLAHIRAQQRQIERLEHELKQVAPEKNMYWTSPRRESSSNRRAAKSLRASDGEIASC